MIYIYSIVIVLAIVFFAYIIAPIGMIAVLLLVVWVLVFRDRSIKYDKPGYSGHTDHHVHVPIQEVPVEFYGAYSAYLKSPEWRAFRKLVLKRDKYRCVDCLARAYHKDFYPTGTKLQVHHIHYDGIETMTFSMDQCVSVCSTCHDIRHGR